MVDGRVRPSVPQSQISLEKSHVFGWVIVMIAQVRDAPSFNVFVGFHSYTKQRARDDITNKKPHETQQSLPDNLLPRNMKIYIFNIYFYSIQREAQRNIYTLAVEYILMMFLRTISANSCESRLVGKNMIFFAPPRCWNNDHSARRRQREIGFLTRSVAKKMT